MPQEPSAHMTRHNGVGVVFKRVSDLIFVCVIPDNAPVYYRCFTSDKALVDWYKSTINQRQAA